MKFEDYTGMSKPRVFENVNNVSRISMFNSYVLIELKSGGCYTTKYIGYRDYESAIADIKEKTIKELIEFKIQQKEKTIAELNRKISSLEEDIKGYQQDLGIY